MSISTYYTSIWWCILQVPWGLWKFMIIQSWRTRKCNKWAVFSSHLTHSIQLFCLYYSPVMNFLLICMCLFGLVFSFGGEKGRGAVEGTRAPGLLIILFSRLSRSWALLNTCFFPCLLFLICSVLCYTPFLSWVVLLMFTLCGMEI
jgi:hypothetical protein